MVTLKNGLTFAEAEVKIRTILGDLPFGLGPEDVVKLFNGKISRGAAYELFNRKDFPAIRIGKRWVCNALSFLRWWQEQEELKKSA